MRKAPGSPSKNETRGRTKAGRPRSRSAGAPAPEPAPPDPNDLHGGARVIRRYGNRRLYDARLRRCVTMDEIGAFVRSGEDVRVIDAESGADITRRVLVQLILEDQNRAQLELLPVSLLRALLGVRSGDVGGWLEQYLKTGADWLERAAKQSAPMMSGWTWPMPMSGFGVPGFGAAQGAAPPAPPPPMSNTPPAAPVDKEPRAAAPATDEAADLKRRLDEMQRQLEGLAARSKRR